MWRCTCGAQLCSRHASRLCWYVMAYKPSLNKPGLPTMPLQRLLLSHLFSLWFPRMFFSIHLNIPQSRSASGAILFEASHLLQRCSTERLPLFSVPVKTGWRRHQSASSNTLIRRRGRAHRSDSPSQLSFISPAGFSISCRMSDILLLCSLNVSQPVWSVSEDAVTLTHSHCVWSTLTVLPDDNELLQSEQRVSETFVQYILMLLYSRDSPLINICSLSAHHDRWHHDVVFCWIKGSLQWSDVIVWPHQTRLRKPWRSRQGQKCKLCFWPESSCFIFHLWELFIFDWTFVQSVTRSRVWFYTLTYFNINTISIFSVNWLLINH